MSDLPQGWATAKLEDLGQIRLGKMLDRAKNRGIETQYLRNVNVRWFHFDLSDLQTLLLSPEELEGLSIRDGDLLICEGGEPGRCAVWRGGQSALTFQKALHRMRTAAGVAPEMLMFQLGADAASGRLRDSFTGTTIKHLTGESLARYTVLLPPEREQIRITDKIVATFARLDSCRSRLDRVPQILKRFREAVLEAAVSGRLTEEWRGEHAANVDAALDVEAIKARHSNAGGHRRGNAAPPTNDVHDLDSSMFPDGWGLVELKELIDPERPITYGILKPGPERSVGVPYIRVADFPGDKLNLSTIRKTSPKIDQEFARARLRAGDLLLSIRGTVGRIVVIPPELSGANITQDSARLSVQESVNARYVLWYLRSNMARRRMQGATKGVAVRGINIGDVRALQVPLPSRQEQAQVVRRIEELIAFVDSIEHQYQVAKDRVAKLTPSVLAKAFRGELVPQDPNDEPASELLKRIQEMKKNAPIKPKKSRVITKVISDSINVTNHPPTVVATSLLADTLKKHGRLAPERLLQITGLDIDEFYNRLKSEIAAGRIKEIRKGTRAESRWLESVR